MKNRIIALMLAAVMLFTFASCNKNKEEEIPDKDRDLIVEEEEVTYTAENIEEAAERIAAVTAEVVKEYYHKTLTKEEVDDVKSSFKNKIYPFLTDIPVYCDELFELIECAEEYVAEVSKSGDYNAEFLLGLYTRFSGVLDGERLGALVYELQMFRLDRKLAQKQEKYDKYGYSYLLEDVENYKALIARAEGLGRAKYSEAFSVLMYMISSVAQTADKESGDIGITVGDVIVILEKQAQKYSALDISEAEWIIVGEMSEEFIPARTSTTLQGKLLWSLDDEDFFVGASSLMPDYIAFYVAVTWDIDEANVELIESGEELSYAVCSELLLNEAELRAFLAKVAQKLPAAGEDSTATVKTHDLSGYSAFLEREVLYVDDVIAALRAFELAPTEEALTLVKDTFVAFIAGINPVIAYTYLYN